jgi:hypothetical protein
VSVFLCRRYWLLNCWWPTLLLSGFFAEELCLLRRCVATASAQITGTTLHLLKASLNNPEPSQYNVSVLYHIYNICSWKGAVK